MDGESWPNLKPQLQPFHFQPNFFPSFSESLSLILSHPLPFYMFLNTFLAQNQVPNDDFLGSQHENCDSTPVPSNDDGGSSGKEHDEPELQPPPSTQVPQPPPSESGSSSASVPFSP
ncbi:hypothetical protein AX15_007367 [Amanita polypyramis BW_CC]|nr:hypothetical protein AX15_007367 [Amanita polypyramis BW_CC]